MIKIFCSGSDKAKEIRIKPIQSIPHVEVDAGVARCENQVATSW